MNHIAFDNPFTRLPDGQTRLLGVIGHPVAHTLSPAIHNPALAWLGLNMRYLAFHVHPDRLAEAVRGLVAIGLVGFNATVPHKEALLPLMDRLDPLAQRIGAVNTVKIHEDGTLHGYNTDAHGFIDALAETSPLDLGHIEVLVLGAGGAARGVVVGLLEAGARRITVANRTLARAEQLAADLGPCYPDARLAVSPLAADSLPLATAGLLVNTTLLGLEGEEIQTIRMDRLPAAALVYDIVYTPRETPLLQAARRQGLATLNGLGML
ncbi:MAG: shikimate dehydrogenase, partial [Magnetococcus sp. DMHC-8]